MRDIAVQIPIEDEEGNLAYSLTDEKTGLTTERYKVSQVIETQTDTRSGARQESRADTVIDIVYPRSGDQSQGRSGWDSTGSIKFYSTVYFDFHYDIHGATRYKMYRVTGGYTKSDSSVTLVKQYVAYGGYGKIINTANWVNYSKQYNLTTGQTSWGFWTPTDWQPIELVSLTGATEPCIGATINYTLKRNAGEWYGNLETRIY